MVVAESRPELKLSEAPFGGLHYFSKQLLEEVGDGEYKEPWATEICRNKKWMQVSS